MLPQRGVAEPDRLAALFPARTHPRCEPTEGVAVFNDHGLDEEAFAGEEQLAAELGGGDRRSGHQLGDLAAGVARRPS